MLCDSNGAHQHDDDTAREDAVNFLFDELPLSEGSGRGDLESLVKGVTNNAGTLGVIGGIGLLISASAMFGAIRNSVAVAMEADCSRGAVRGKGLDLLLILGLGLLFVGSFASTVLNRFDPTNDLHRRNLEWLAVRDGATVVTDTGALAERLSRERP